MKYDKKKFLIVKINFFTLNHYFFSKKYLIFQKKRMYRSKIPTIFWGNLFFLSLCQNLRGKNCFLCFF